MTYKCQCKDNGPLIPVRVAITDNGKMLGTVCFRQWCPKCKNPRLDEHGNILYYQIKSDGSFTTAPLDFWVPETVKFQYKMKFINTVLKIAHDNRFVGKQEISMQQIREAYPRG